MQKPKNSVEFVRERRPKERLRIKGKYFGRCLILMSIRTGPSSNIRWIWEHSIQKVIQIENNKREKKNGSKIWSKIRSIEIENIDLPNQSIKKNTTDQDIAKATEPFAQCLMDVVEYILNVNCKSRKNYDFLFTSAGFQHKAQEQILDVIKGDFEIKYDDKDIDKWIEVEKERLEFYRRHPNKKRSKLLLVYENLSNAAFVAIGYMMIVYNQSLKRAYDLFRMQFEEAPIFNKLHVYVLQSLDYARFGSVTLSMDHVCYHNLNESMYQNGIVNSDYE